jgi:hypothetical protein
MSTQSNQTESNLQTRSNFVEVFDTTLRDGMQVEGV